MYLNNDFEDLTSSLAYKLLKNKLNFNLTGGLQRNNLNSDKVTEMLRKIYAISANFLQNSKWNFNLQYSNFNASTQKTLVTQMDTSLVPLSIKNYAQVTESAALQVMFNNPSQKNTFTSFLSIAISPINGYNGGLSEDTDSLITPLDLNSFTFL